MFDPSWGVYDMAVGEKIVSVFSGPADISAFDDEPYLQKKQHTRLNILQSVYVCTNYTSKLEMLVQIMMSKIPSIWEELKLQFAGDWLCALEILEIVQDEDIRKEVESVLKNKSVTEKEYTKLITDGLELIA